MLKLKRRIVEGKQVGNLYHTCSIKSLLHNISTDSITLDHSGRTGYVLYNKNGKRLYSGNGSADDTIDPSYYDSMGVSKLKYFISFTRDKNYRLSKDVLLIIDGNKLSENYKIAPYNHYSSNTHDVYLPNRNKKGFFSVHSNDEYEEQVEDKDGKGIHPLHNFLLSIEIIPSVYNNLSQHDKNIINSYVNQYNIPLHI